MKRETRQAISNAATEKGGKVAPRKPAPKREPVSDSKKSVAAEKGSQPLPKATKRSKADTEKEVTDKELEIELPQPPRAAGAAFEQL